MKKFRVKLERQLYQEATVEIEAETPEGAINKLRYGTEDAVFNIPGIEETWHKIEPINWSGPRPDDEVFFPEINPDGTSEDIEEVK
jgi:hypothetical protein